MRASLGVESFQSFVAKVDKLHPAFRVILYLDYVRLRGTHQQHHLIHRSHIIRQHQDKHAVSSGRAGEGPAAEDFYGGLVGKV